MLDRVLLVADRLGMRAKDSAPNLRLNASFFGTEPLQPDEVTCQRRLLGGNMSKKTMKPHSTRSVESIAVRAVQGWCLQLPLAGSEVRSYYVSQEFKAHCLGCASKDRAGSLVFTV